MNECCFCITSWWILKVAILDSCKNWQKEQCYDTCYNNNTVWSHAYYIDPC